MSKQKSGKTTHFENSHVDFKNLFGSTAAVWERVERGPILSVVE